MLQTATSDAVSHGGWHSFVCKVQCWQGMQSNAGAQAGIALEVVKPCSTLDVCCRDASGQE